MNYIELKEKHEKEFNEFPIMFAFTDEQFAEGMKELGLEPTDNDKVYNLKGTQGFYKRTDSEALFEMFGRHTTEFEQVIKEDVNGDGFILDMFKYELANHEYGYTNEIEPALEALGLDMETVEASPNLLAGLNNALATYSQA